MVVLKSLRPLPRQGVCPLVYQTVEPQSPTHRPADLDIKLGVRENARTLVGNPTTPSAIHPHPFDASHRDGVKWWELAPQPTD